MPWNLIFQGAPLGVIQAETPTIVREADHCVYLLEIDQLFYAILVLGGVYNVTCLVPGPA